MRTAEHAPDFAAVLLRAVCRLALGELSERDSVVISGTSESERAPCEQGDEERDRDEGEVDHDTAPIGRRGHSGPAQVFSAPTGQTQP